MYPNAPCGRWIALKHGSSSLPGAAQSALSCTRLPSGGAEPGQASQAWPVSSERWTSCVPLSGSRVCVTRAQTLTWLPNARFCSAPSAVRCKGRLLLDALCVLAVRVSMRTPLALIDEQRHVISRPVTIFASLEAPPEVSPLKPWLGLHDLESTNVGA